MSTLTQWLLLTVHLTTSRREASEDIYFSTVLSTANLSISISQINNFFFSPTHSYLHLHHHKHLITIAFLSVCLSLSLSFSLSPSHSHTHTHTQTHTHKSYATLANVAVADWTKANYLVYLFIV